MKKKIENKKFVLWLTGLSGAGKTTIGDEIYKILENKGLSVKRLDGDIIRKKINKNLSFSKQDRNKNLRVVIDLVKLLNNQNNNVTSASLPRHALR